MKTEPEREEMRHMATETRQTAARLCEQMGTQLNKLAECRARLQESMSQLRKMRRALPSVPGQRHDPEVVALVNILRLIP